MNVSGFSLLNSVITGFIPTAGGKDDYKPSIEWNNRLVTFSLCMCTHHVYASFHQTSQDDI